MDTQKQKLKNAIDQATEACNEEQKRYLDARALIAGDLFREGEITRCECFRMEVDAVLGRNTGEMEFQKNTDYIDNLM